MRNGFGKNSPNWRGGNIETSCPECGKTFFVKRFRVRNKEKPFCSRSCASSAKKGKDTPNWRGGNIIKQCEHCGKEYSTKRVYIFRSRFCSRICQYKHKTKRTPVPCPTCGTIRMLVDSEIKRKRFFCNIHCYRLHRPTSIEKAIREELENRGVYFVPEHKIGRWSIDIFIPSASVAIECDGEYWHRDTTRDERKDAFLKENGIRVFRFSEAEIRKSPKHCIDSVVHFL